MKEELEVFVTTDTKFEEIYGNGEYKIILKFMPFYPIRKKQKEKLEELFSNNLLKLTLEEVKK